MGACGPRHRGVRHYFQKLKSTPLYSVSDCRLWRQTLAWWITKIVTALSHFGHFHRGAVCRLHVVVFSYIVLSHFEAQFIKKKSFFVHLDETLVMNLNWFPRWCSSNCNIACSITIWYVWTLEVHQWHHTHLKLEPLRFSLLQKAEQLRWNQHKTKPFNPSFLAYFLVLVNLSFPSVLRLHDQPKPSSGSLHGLCSHMISFHVLRKQT